MNRVLEAGAVKHGGRAWKAYLTLVRGKGKVTKKHSALLFNTREAALEAAAQWKKEIESGNE